MRTRCMVMMAAGMLILAAVLVYKIGEEIVISKDDCVIIEPTQKDLENQGFVAGSICF